MGAAPIPPRCMHATRMPTSLTPGFGASETSPAQLAAATAAAVLRHHHHHRPRRRHRASWGRHKRGGTTRSSGSTTANGSNMPAGVKRGLRPEAVEAAAPPPPEASSQRRKCRNSWRRRLMEPVTPVVVCLDDAHRRAAFSRGQLPCGHKVIQVSVVSSACSTGGTTASFTLRQCGYKQM
ncbi:hypothetical protein PF001_g14824 [Phytophthora fragariae]|uniref:Uncharacterized protein n=2 Tax=Phytophthora fragariae TaxID=53985 RepID=A0A6A4D5S5_9STRA|nr:hypothetical protein PF001_g14824 [Phytophthora fragariae]